MFFLDTNVVIGVMNRRAPHFVARIEAERARGTPLLLSTVALYELRYGASKSTAPTRNLARIDDFLAIVSSLVAFEAEDASEAGEIRAALEARGFAVRPLRPADLRTGEASPAGCGDRQPPRVRPRSRPRRRRLAVRLKPYPSIIATARVQPADARAILTGKQAIMKPCAGRLSRLCSFSMWQ